MHCVGVKVIVVLILIRFLEIFGFTISSRLSIREHSQKLSSSPDVVFIEKSETKLRNEVLASLKDVFDPEKEQDIIALNYVQNVEIKENGEVSVVLMIPGASSEIFNEYKNACIDKLKYTPWIKNIVVIPKIIATANELSRPQQKSASGMSGVKYVIVVSSCKGGVGKSTVSVNLAYTLQRAGAKVGILDADIYGPSLPTMTKPKNMDIVTRLNQIVPLEYEGVKLMSMGFINKGVAIMRGPMVNQVLNQFVTSTAWGDLDYLIVDMPPGTGDVQLTLSQIMNITAAIIVTTPQRLSFVDVVKGIDMFDTVNIPCIAVVENMAEIKSYEFNSEFFKDLGNQVTRIAEISSSLSLDSSKTSSSISKCIEEAVEKQARSRRIFGEGHLQRLREMWGIENLISLPLLEDVSRSGDSGLPYVLQYPTSPVSRAIEGLAETVINEIVKLSHSSTLKDALLYDQATGLLRYGEIAVSPFDLRVGCRCAACVEEFSGRPLLDPRAVPKNVAPLALAPIGRYAVAVDWSDGHKSLYPFRQLTAYQTMK